VVLRVELSGIRETLARRTGYDDIDTMQLIKNCPSSPIGDIANLGTRSKILLVDVNRDRIDVERKFTTEASVCKSEIKPAASTEEARKTICLPAHDFVRPCAIN